MLRRKVTLLPSIIFVLVVLVRTEETLASVPDDFSSTTSTEIDSTGSSEATSEVDSSSFEDVETTTMPYKTTEDTIEKGSNHHHQEEPKLPVDLLSEDILLDPNVVLARLARDLGAQTSSSEYFYRRPLRRTQQEGSDGFSNAESKRRNYVPHRPPIYPVFPGRK